MSQTTKRALAASLKKLLQKKSLNKITINDIAEDCGINRMTFYYHFRDIYDLVEWTVQNEAEQLLRGKYTIDSWQDAMNLVFQRILEDKTVFLNLYHSLGREQVERYIYRVLGNLILMILKEESKDMQICEQDREFVADFFKYAFTGFILEWVSGGMKEDPKRITDRIARLAQGETRRSMEKFAVHTEKESVQ
ncbi:MAG: TetR/AcrR family transcriptional regulator C-terminal domain-containing protein [Hominenteromicrobium sp.]